MGKMVKDFAMLQEMQEGVGNRHEVLVSDINTGCEAIHTCNAHLRKGFIRIDPMMWLIIHIYHNWKMDECLQTKWIILQPWK